MSDQVTRSYTKQKKKKNRYYFRRMYVDSGLSCFKVGVTLSRLASVQRSLDKLDESIASLEEAKEKFANDDIYRAVILSKMCVVYRYKGDSTNSLKFAEEASKITDEQLGSKEHPGKLMEYISGLRHQKTLDLYFSYYLKLDRCIMQFERFDWLSGHGISAIIPCLKNSDH